ncbi:MAG: hypothetical protein FWD49_06875 [Firmicutes bacterium]|nr:hypothetical protein [Bacillota bacterium]
MKQKKQILSDNPDTLASEVQEEKPRPKGEDKHKHAKKKSNSAVIWAVKIIIITFVLAGIFSYLSEITTSSAHLAISFLLLVLLIVIAVIFDAVAVAVTACDLAPLLSMAARKVRGSKIAVKLVKNAEKVANISGDVIGDICGIISGACTIAIAFRILSTADAGSYSFWITIGFSSIVAAITVGCKAIFKEVAMKNSKEIIMFVSRLLSVFSKEEMREKKKRKLSENKQQQGNKE